MCLEELFVFALILQYTKWNSSLYGKKPFQFIWICVGSVLDCGGFLEGYNILTTHKIMVLCLWIYTTSIHTYHAHKIQLNYTNFDVYIVSIHSFITTPQIVCRRSVVKLLWKSWLRNYNGSREKSFFYLKFHISYESRSLSFQLSKSTRRNNFHTEKISQQKIFRSISFLNQ